MDKKIIFLALLLTSFIGCTNHLDNQIQGVWVIDKYDGQFDLLTNGLILHNNHICGLPMTHYNGKEQFKLEGKWETFSYSGKSFLRIYNAEHPLADTFLISKTQQITDPKSYGKLLKVILIADSTKLKCTKAIN